MNMRFGRSPRRSFRPQRRTAYRAVAHVTRNRFENTLGVTTGGTETPQSICLAVEAPGDRSTAVPAGCIVRSIVCNLRATEPVDGKHQCLLVYRPASENVATPIASYWDSTDPLTEEGVKLRRLAMGRCHTREVNAATDIPHVFTCRWKGQKRMYDGDDISAWILDEAGTTYRCQTWMSFTQ